MVRSTGYSKVFVWYVSLVDMCQDSSSLRALSIEIKGGLFAVSERCGQDAQKEKDREKAREK